MIWQALCSKNEYTKSESNSQPVLSSRLMINNCVQRTNIQNLKAIHNTSLLTTATWSIVFKERIYKIWKQFTTSPTWNFPFRLLCSKNEYTKSESNSQRLLPVPGELRIVFKERIYKIWKQFTTIIRVDLAPDLLCSKNEYTKSESNSQLSILFSAHCIYCVQRTNIQNLKAIHNDDAAQENKH